MRHHHLFDHIYYYLVTAEKEILIKIRVRFRDFLVLEIEN
jgi:hypothetical protein